MSAYDLVMYRGDDRSFLVTLSGTIDLTTALDVVFTAKSKPADVAPTIDLDLVSGITVLSALTLRVDIPAAATAALVTDTKLVWDLQITEADGSIRTVPEPSTSLTTLGTLLIRNDVTRA